MGVGVGVGRNVDVRRGKGAAEQVGRRAWMGLVPVSCRCGVKKCECESESERDVGGVSVD